MLQGGVAQAERGELAEPAEIHAIDPAQPGQPVRPVGEFVAGGQRQLRRGAGEVGEGFQAVAAARSAGSTSSALPLSMPEGSSQVRSNCA